MADENGKSRYYGACHCGAVKFEVEANPKTTVRECNCSICAKTGFIHLIVKKEQFTLLSGDEELTHYKFNTGTADHMFCKHCGVKAFYVPRSHPNGYSINARCLDEWPDLPFQIAEAFDGQNWEAARLSLD